MKNTYYSTIALGFALLIQVISDTFLNDQINWPLTILTFFSTLIIFLIYYLIESKIKVNLNRSISRTHILVSALIILAISIFGNVSKYIQNTEPRRYFTYGNENYNNQFPFNAIITVPCLFFVLCQIIWLAWIVLTIVKRKDVIQRSTSAKRHIGF